MSWRTNGVADRRARLASPQAAQAAMRRTVAQRCPAFMVECWAVYDHVDIGEIVRQPILLNTEGLERVESLYRLRVF